MKSGHTTTVSATKDDVVIDSVRTPGRKLRIVMLAVAIALLILAGERAYTWKSVHDRQENRDHALSAAKAEVLGLISMSSETSDVNIAALLDGATAEFREELQSQAGRLGGELRQNEVDASGEIVSAAVSTFDDDKATVIVAARGTVSNKQTSQPEPRNYRLEVNVVSKGDRWLVSGLEFVA